jgi:hypothetical protein
MLRWFAMAKTKTETALATRPHHPRAPQPIIIREKVAGKTTKHGKSGHRRGHQSAEKQLMGFIIGGFAMGFLDKPDGPGKNIPVIPVLGKAGTIAVACHFFGKGKAGIVTDVRNAAAVVAAYEYGNKGSISGDDDDDDTPHGGRPGRPGAPHARGHV